MIDEPLEVTIARFPMESLSFIKLKTLLSRLIKEDLWS